MGAEKYYLSYKEDNIRQELINPPKKKSEKFGQGK